MQSAAAVLVSAGLLAAATTPPAPPGPILLAQAPLPTIDRQYPTGSAARARQTIARAVPNPREIASAVRSPHGYYIFDAEIDGVPTTMVFDTGASAVTLRAEDAERAGIDVGALNYSVRFSTANGLTFVAPVLIRTMQVGSITRMNVPAVVAKPGALAFNLLGQTFMSTTAGFSSAGDLLVLHGN